MKITYLKFYGGAKDKICRLGLASLFLELQEIIFLTEVKLLEEKQETVPQQCANGLTNLLRRKRVGNKGGAGAIDWTKRMRDNETIISRIGVEVQVSREATY